MRIAELSAFHVRIPLRKTVRHASHSRTSTETLVVRCRLDNGIEGWGEGLPRSYVTGDTIDTAFEQLRDTDLKQQLGAAFASLEDAITVAQSLRCEIRATNMRDCFGNAVRCAVELSILDAAARSEGKPLAAVTGLVAESAGIRANRERVQYSAAFTTTSRRKAVKLAWIVRLTGFRLAKVKVGVDGVDDVAWLRTIRRNVGKQMDLRIDANEAWTCDNLVSKLQPLQQYGITAVEQPVPHEHVAGLAEVRKRIDTPIMLDESLCSLSDAHRAIEHGTCDLFNIRLSKCGGFVNSLKLAAIAHRGGLGYQLGCQVGETGILSAAGRHFAVSVADIRYLEGSYDRHLVRERLTVEDLTFGWGGYAAALKEPGLGITIDQQALQRVLVREEHWPIG